MSAVRKRPISSCIPCYTRKQKCNREAPCNHCTRRSCPEACIYYPVESATSSPSHGTIVPIPEAAAESSSAAIHRASNNASTHRHDHQQHRDLVSAAGFPDQQQHRDEIAQDVGLADLGGDQSMLAALSVNDDQTAPAAALAGSLGYFQYSNCNTLAVMQRLGVAPVYSPFSRRPALSPEAVEDVHRALQNAPDRQVIDFLIQHFVSEVCWMEQMVHAPWLISRYRDFHTTSEGQFASVSSVQFFVLVLRICSYTLQFLPSPGYPLDTIRGAVLADVRHACHDVAEKLESVLEHHTGGQGSLVMIQQLAFKGLKCQTEGRLNDFWDILGRAIRMAQSMGLHRDDIRGQGSVGQVDEEVMARRVFCNLFIWDSQLARQLDRVPATHGRAGPSNWSGLHVREWHGASADSASEMNMEYGETNGPDAFLERQLQALLADFWRAVAPEYGAEYDIVDAEERYEKFCAEYLPKLPRIFALDTPDESWDRLQPKLALQRRLLHIAIFECIGSNYLPLVLWRPEAVSAHKAILIFSQRKALATAALHTIDCIAQLHNLLGTRHTRHAAIIAPTFEAAVSLLSLLMQPQFPGSCAAHAQSQNTEYGALPGSAKGIDILQPGMIALTRIQCVQAVQSAIKRLRLLAEISSGADLCANVLSQLWDKLMSTMDPSQCPLKAIEASGNVFGSAGAATNTVFPSHRAMESSSGFEAEPLSATALTTPPNWSGLAEPSVANNGSRLSHATDEQSAMSPWMMDFLAEVSPEGYQGAS